MGKSPWKGSCPKSFTYNLIFPGHIVGTIEMKFGGCVVIGSTERCNPCQCRGIPSSGGCPAIFAENRSQLNDFVLKNHLTHFEMGRIKYPVDISFGQILLKMGRILSNIRPLFQALGVVILGLWR